MASLVFFHAHPDDEAIATAGSMALAAAAGHRVVLVVATRGERGEIQPGVLDEGEQLGVRRTVETYQAAEILGVSRVEFLGYLDSGMMGTPENDTPGSFWQAEVEHAAGRLAAILREEDAQVLVTYDDNGGYGHPDHIQVHRVGHRAAALAGTPTVLESTISREMITAAREMAPDMFEDAPEVATDSFGKPESEITHAIDVTAVTDLKRRAMSVHASQISPEDFFLAMPPEMFQVAFGTEWYIQPAAPRGEGEAFRSSLVQG